MKTDKFTTIAILILWILAISIAFTDLDNYNWGKQSSWTFVNLSVLTGIVGNQFLWSKFEHGFLGAGFTYIKLCLIIYLLSGWWSLSSPEISQMSLDYFWTCPPFLAILSFFEAGVITKYFKTENKQHITKNKPH